MARRKTGKGSSARRRAGRTASARRRKTATAASRRKRPARARKPARGATAPRRAGRAAKGRATRTTGGSARRPARQRRPAQREQFEARRARSPVPRHEPDALTREALDADRERLGQRRGEDMRVAAEQAENEADRRQARDDVHERDISGS